MINTLGITSMINTYVYPPWENTLGIPTMENTLKYTVVHRSHTLRYTFVHISHTREVYPGVYNSLYYPIGIPWCV